MKIITLALAACLSATYALAAGVASDNSIQSKIAAAAAHHKVASVLLLSNEVGRSSKFTREVYSLALYALEPTKFGKQYVQHFPTDTQGVMGDMSHATQILNLSRWFPYNSLVKLASSGDRLAVRKLLLSLGVADGGPAGLLGDGIGAITQRYPNLVFHQIGVLPIAAGEKIITDAYPWCSAGRAAIGRMVAISKRERAQKAAIESTLSHCQG